MRAPAVLLALLPAARAADGARTPDVPEHHTAGGFRNPPTTGVTSVQGLIAHRIRMLFLEEPGAAAPALDRATAERGRSGTRDGLMWLGHGG